MEGDLRAALLVLILISAPLAGSMGAGAEFKCFQTPGEGIRCACIGASDCSEMKSSGSCSGGYRSGFSGSRGRRLQMGWGVTSEGSIVRDSASLSEPTSPFLIAVARERALMALS